LFKELLGYTNDLNSNEKPPCLKSIKPSLHASIGIGSFYLGGATVAFTWEENWLLKDVFNSGRYYVDPRMIWVNGKGKLLDSEPKIRAIAKILFFSYSQNQILNHP